MNPLLRQKLHKSHKQTADTIFCLSDIVYLSGPMTGITNSNRETFNKVKAMVAKECGATVISPADLRQGPSWEHQMRQCIRYIADCTKMLMLPGWTESRGALVEHMLACQLTIPRWYLDDDLMRASSDSGIPMTVSTYMSKVMRKSYIMENMKE